MPTMLKEMLPTNSESPLVRDLPMAGQSSGLFRMNRRGVVFRFDAKNAAGIMPPTTKEAAVATAAPVRPQPKPATNSASSRMFVSPQAMLVMVPISGRPATM